MKKSPSELAELSEADANAKPNAVELAIRDARLIWRDARGLAMSVSFWRRTTSLIYLREDIAQSEQRHGVLSEHGILMREHGHWNIYWIPASQQRLDLLERTERWRNLKLKAADKRLVQRL